MRKGAVSGGTQLLIVQRVNGGRRESSGSLSLSLSCLQQGVSEAIAFLVPTKLGSLADLSVCVSVPDALFCSATIALKHVQRGMLGAGTSRLSGYNLNRHQQILRLFGALYISFRIHHGGSVAKALCC